MDSAYVQVFPTSTPMNHNDLGSIQGGAADDYYHMTSAQHGIAILNNYGKNLIQNASFQDSDGDDLPDFWTLYTTPTLALAVDTLFPSRKGNQVTITAVGSASEGIQIAGSATNWLKVLPFTPYTFALDYKATAGDNLSVYIWSFNDAVAGTLHISDATLASTTATRKTYTFTTDNDANNLRIIVRSVADGDICIVSHPKLEQGAIATPYVDETPLNYIQIDNYHKDLGTNPTGLFLHSGENMLENPSFESYDIDTNVPAMWALSGTPTLAIAPDTLFPGRKGNQITITCVGNTYEGIIISPGVTNWLKVLPFTKYTFSIDYKATAGDFASILVRSYNGAVAGTIHINVDTLDSTDAVRVAYTFTTDADADNLFVEIRGKNDGDIVIFSHLKLEQGAIATPYVAPNRDRSVVTTIASHATPTPVIVAKTTKYFMTAIAEVFAPGAPTGIPRDGDRLCYSFLDDGTGYAIIWNAIHEAIVALPGTTTATKPMSVEFEYDATAVKYKCIRADELA